jgi:hypothetical protein
VPDGFDPGLPDGFDPGLPDGFDPGLPDGFDPPLGRSADRGRSGLSLMTFPSCCMI